jgi:hypothetical protein
VDAEDDKAADMRNFLHGIARVLNAHARAILYHAAALFRTEIQAKTPSVSKSSDGNRSFIRHSVITAPGAPRIDRQYARAGPAVSDRVGTVAVWP